MAIIHRFAILIHETDINAATQQMRRDLRAAMMSIGRFEEKHDQKLYCYWFIFNTRIQAEAAAKEAKQIGFSTAGLLIDPIPTYIPDRKRRASKEYIL